MKNTIYINLFGGPGTGKSTLAAGIYHRLRLAGETAEYTPEYAKDKVWADHHNVLEDQIYIFAKQHRKQLVLEGKVDYVITDSPLLFSTVYAKPPFSTPAFKQLVKERFESFNNFNLLLERTVPYEDIGREQDYEEALLVDMKVREVLDDADISYWTVWIDLEDQSQEKLIGDIIDNFQKWRKEIFK